MAKSLCEHLQPLLDQALKQGNSIVAEETFWAENKLTIVLRDRIDLAAFRTAELVPSGVEDWTFVAPDWAPSAGLTCKEHKHVITWPTSSRPLRP
jgi:hypothetical protein